MDLLSKVDELLSVVDHSKLTIGCVTMLDNNNTDHESSSYNGSFVWSINDCLDDLLNITGYHSFTSPSFKISDSEWQLQIYPNGTKQEFAGSVSIHLKLININDYYKSVFTKFYVKCIETGHQFKLYQLFQLEKEHGANRLLALEYLKQYNLKQLSFIIHIDIIRINSILTRYKQIKTLEINDNLQNIPMTINWRIDEDLVNAVKSFKTGNVVQSDIYHNMFMVESFHCGWYCTFGLIMTYFPPNISRFIVKWKLICNQTNTNHIMIDEFTLKDNIFIFITNTKFQEFMAMHTSCNLTSQVTILDAFDIDHNQYQSLQHTENTKISPSTQRQMNTKTVIITHRFVQNIENNLRHSREDNNNPMSYYIIPHSVVQICIDYVGDHFAMHQGSYLWRIDDKSKIEAIKNNEHNRSCFSDVFKMCGLYWNIEFSPNTKPDPSDDIEQPTTTGIYLKLLTLPNTWNTVWISVTFRCPEINRKYGIQIIYNEQKVDKAWGTRQFALMEQIKQYDPKKFTILCDIQILKIILKKDQQLLYHRMSEIDNLAKYTQIEWKITEDIMQSLRINGNRMIYESDTFDNLWTINYKLYQPDGNDTVYFIAGLSLTQLPKSSIHVVWKIKVMECDGVEYSTASVFTKKQSRHYWNMNMLRWDTVKSFKSLTLTAEIRVSCKK